MNLTHTLLPFRRCLCLLLLLFTRPLLAEEAVDLAAVIEHRQANFEAMGKAMKSFRQQLRSGNADWAQIEAAAEVIVEHAGQINDWFPEGSGQGSQLETDALDYIWRDRVRFAEIDQALVPAAQGLAAAAKQGNPASLVPQIREVGSVCKQCHDSYRAD